MSPNRTQEYNDFRGLWYYTGAMSVTWCTLWWYSGSAATATLATLGFFCVAIPLTLFLALMVFLLLCALVVNR